MTDRVDELLHEVERLARADPRGRRQRRAARPDPGARTGVTVSDVAAAPGCSRAGRSPTRSASPSPRTSPRSRDTRGRPPGLRVVIVGKDAPSTVYLEQILRGCAKVGIDAGFVELEGEATEARVTATVRELNDDPTVDGVIVQMPLPADDPPSRRSSTRSTRPRTSTASIRSTPACCASATTGSCRPPPTPPSRSCAGPGSRSRAATRSSSAAPPSSACRRRSCSSRRTRRSPSATRGRATSPATSRRADIVVVAAGQPGLVTGAMLKPGAVVVDVGINVVDGRIVGDVDFASARRGRLGDHARARRRRPADQRPAADPPDPRRRAPGRDGPCRRRRRPGVPAATRPVRRRPMSFPSDLEIARSVTPRPIVDIAARARDPRRRARAVRTDQGQGHARGDHAPRGRAAARQVRRRHRDHADAARRGQVDDHGRAGPGPQPDRPARRRSTSASRRSGRSSGSRAAPPAAATARSSRWRTSTST